MGDLLSASEAAKLLGITQCAVYQATLLGRLIPVDPAPRGRRYSRESIERYRAETEAYRTDRKARRNGRKAENRWNIVLDEPDARAFRAACEAAGVRSMSHAFRLLCRGEAVVRQGRLILDRP